MSTPSPTPSPTPGAQTISAVVGCQWGDESKGKFVDVLAAEADLVVRVSGGNNAGHTVKFDGKSLALHLLPSAVGRPDVGLAVGPGVVLNPDAFFTEYDDLEARGFTPGRVRIDPGTAVVLPSHLQLDKLQERYRQGGKLGTTLRGIGPCYADREMGLDVQVGELVDLPATRDRIVAVAAYHDEILSKRYHRGGADLDQLLDTLQAWGDRLRPLVGETDQAITEVLAGGGQVLLEGAQATMLDLDMGTYPFVTSSHTTASGLAADIGRGPGAIGRVVGITKAYTTRVGEGPFPTELDDEIGLHMSTVGEEVGVSTGRLRRCGWYDAVVTDHASRVNGLTELVVAKLDVLSGLDPVRICTAYEIDGERTSTVPPSWEELARATPVYEDHPGWDDDIFGLDRLDGLPRNARSYLDRLSELAGLPISFIGTGPDRVQTIRAA